MDDIWKFSDDVVGVEGRVVSTGWNRWEENWRKLMIAGEKDNRVTWFGYPVVKFRNWENFDNFQLVWCIFKSPQDMDAWGTNI